MRVTLIIALVLFAGVAAAALSWGIPAIRSGRRPPIEIEIVYGDITNERTDAIVNAAKPSLLGGGGVDGAIHKAAGPRLLEECRALADMLPPGGLPPGFALITHAGDLPVRWIIHTVGPRYDETRNHVGQGQAAVLRACYTAALAAADAVHAETVAFPLISAGAYGWPVPDAIVQALTAIRTADTKVRTARLVIFSPTAYRMAKTIAGAER